jgi:hypothetical protein
MTWENPKWQNSPPSLFEPFRQAHRLAQGLELVETAQGPERCRGTQGHEPVERAMEDTANSKENSNHQLRITKS